MFHPLRPPPESDKRRPRVLLPWVERESMQVSGTGFSSPILQSQSMAQLQVGVRCLRLQLYRPAISRHRRGHIAILLERVPILDPYRREVWHPVERLAVIMCGLVPGAGIARAIRSRNSGAAAGTQSRCFAQSLRANENPERTTSCARKPPLLNSSRRSGRTAAVSNPALCQLCHSAVSIGLSARIEIASGRRQVGNRQRLPFDPLAPLT